MQVCDLHRRRWQSIGALAVLPFAAVLQGGCGGGSAATPGGGTPDAGGDPRITLFPTQPGAGAWMIAAGPDGNMWFTERGDGTVDCHKIARITPSGEITEFPLPDGSQPWWITAGPDGAMWFTDNYAQKIGRIATDGTVVEYPVPSVSAFPIAIALGPDGNLWFTERTTITNVHPTGNIARITTDGAVTEFPIGTEPAEIAAGPDGNIWYVAFYHTAVGRIAPDGASNIEFPLPQSSFPAHRRLGRSDRSLPSLSETGSLSSAEPGFRLRRAFRTSWKPGPLNHAYLETKARRSRSILPARSVLDS